MSTWSASFTYAFRTLRRQPTFVLVALLTLALGIGANTAIFSVIKTVVLNPLPYEAPERIAVLWEVNPEGNQDRVSVPTFEDWQEERAHVRIDGRVSPRGLLVLGHAATRATSPASAPRPICSRCSAPARASAAHFCPRSRSSAPTASWSSATASGNVCSAPSPNIVGSTIKLDALPFTVVGVMPRRLRVPDRDDGGGVGAAGVRSEGPARPVAPRAIAHRGRPRRDRRRRWRRRRTRSACWRTASPTDLQGQQRRLERPRRGRRTSSSWPRRGRRWWC